LIMPEFEQVCRRLFLDSSWGVKCVLGALLMAVPVLQFAAFGYLGRAARAGARGEEFYLPDWEEWGVLFVRGVFFFLIFLGLAGGLFLAAWVVSLPFRGWLGIVAFVPFIPAVLLAGPLAGAGWYRYLVTGEVAEGFRVRELLRLLRETWPRLTLPTLAFIGILAAGAPLFPLAFFIGGLVVFYFYCSVFSHAEARRVVNSESSFSVL
jgi:hypothetical protein